MCEIGTSNETETIMVFDRDAILPAVVVLTEMGLCRIFNLCAQENLLRNEADGARIFKGIYEHYYGEFNELPERYINDTPPYKAKSENIEVRVKVEYSEEKVESERQDSLFVDIFLLVIHSPFELPIKASQQFYMSGDDYDNFFVTPQLDTIDDTMTEMDPLE